MVLAYEVYLERGLKYGQLWKSDGWRGNVHHIMSKAARIRRMFWDNDTYDDVDDVVDLINYCVFMLVNFRRGNKTGNG